MFCLTVHINRPIFDVILIVIVFGREIVMFPEYLECEYCKYHVHFVGLSHIQLLLLIYADALKLNGSIEDNSDVALNYRQILTEMGKLIKWHCKRHHH